MHDIVKSYLIHYGYIETLQALEDEPPKDQDMNKNGKTHDDDQ